MRRRADECAQLVGVANNQTSVLHPEPKFGMSDWRPVPSVRFAPLSGSTLRPGRPLTSRGLLRWLLASDRHQHFLLTTGDFAPLHCGLRVLLRLCSTDALPQRIHEVHHVLAT